MGITIHYTLISNEYEAVLSAILAAEKMARESGYKVEEVAEEVRVCYLKLAMQLRWRSPEDSKRYLEERYGGCREEVLDEVPDEPPWCWIAVNYPMPGYYTYAVPWISREEGRPTRYEGIVVSIPTAEPFTLAFYKLGEYYVCDGSTKTQPFTVDEVKPNLEYHKWICRLLRMLRERGGWWSFYVSDEGEYYETLDESKLLKNFEVSSKMIFMLANAVDKMFEAEELGGGAQVGGKIDVRSLRKRLEGLYEEDQDDHRSSYQSSLDDFMEVDEG